MEDHQENLIEKFIEQKFDLELREKWERQLKEEFQTSKSTPSTSKSIRRFNLSFLALAAGFLLLAVIGILLLTQSISRPGSAKQLATNYLAETEIYHPGSFKGQQASNISRDNAILHFNTQNYPEAIQNFLAIENKTSEDNYYLALSYFLNQDFDQAISGFEGLIISNSDFEEQINWYLSLSLLLSDKLNSAQKQLLSIEASDWNYKKAQEILNTLQDPLD